MSYYQGDFYQGDPGFFSFLGGLAKKAVGFIPGVGPVASSAIGAITSAAGGSMVRKGAAGMVRKAGAIVVKHPVLTGAAAAGVIGAGGVMGGRRMGAAGRAARVPGMRRHRRMNVCNVRALRRSIRRTQGFAKLAMRTIHLVHPKKHARFGGFKRRTKKRTV